MRRREFVIGGLTAAAWPFAAQAQKPVMPVIGYLFTGKPESSEYLLSGFRQGLSETGYDEGRNVSIEYAWANDQYDRLPSLATDLVRRQVTVLVVGGIPGAKAAIAATKTVPIVFLTGADPISAGLVASLNRPEGNLTGVTTLGDEIGAKRLELLHELMPAANEIGVLVNQNNNDAEIAMSYVRAAANKLGVILHIQHAGSETDFETAFAAFEKSGVNALYIVNDPFLIGRAAQLATLSNRRSIPAIFYTKKFAEAGGLMSYGGNYLEAARLTGVYTGRILKGERPADLPVQQSTGVELIINLKTARALGISVPLSLLGRADEVIE
jgi:putative tryptophan/tyrosine transport system substrate-binding protein